MIRRRATFLALGALALAPLAAYAQRPSAGVAHIGVLLFGSPQDMASRLEGLRAGLREQGYVEGRNLFLTLRYADGRDERLPGLAAELVHLKVDLIVTHGRAGPLAARQATGSIPIVIAAGADPVALGLAASLSRPGGNVTGATFLNEELGARRVELLKEAVPRVAKMAYLATPADSPQARQSLDKVVATGVALKVEIPLFLWAGTVAFDGAFKAMTQQHVSAVVISDFTSLNRDPARMASLARKHRLPAMGNPALADAGGLLGYGVSFEDMFRRAAMFVGKILKGAKPGELPIERPGSFELVVNQLTAKALGIRLPQSVLLQATRVIE